MMLANIALLSLASAQLFDNFEVQYAVGTPLFLESYSAFKSASGIGPYSSRRSDGVYYTLPEGFTLDQAVMFHRHGERYPDADDSVDYEAALAKVDGRQITPDKYVFLKDWTYYADNNTFGMETTTGPYSGIGESRRQGRRFQGRYGQLVRGQQYTEVWSSSSQRVVDTAYAWSNGFFNGNDRRFNVTVIKEEDFANSLTPKCKGPEDTTCEDTTTSVPEFATAAARLNHDLGISTLNSSDISNLMEVGLYEINVRGDSPWLSVFTPEEWLAKEYARSYRVFCKRAHGSPKGMASGSVLTNATVQLLTQGPGGRVQPFTIVFVHDTQISQMVGAAGLLNSTNKFEHGRVTFGNQLEISDVVPMGSNLIFERINNGTNNYVRVVLNEAVLPIDWCHDGPGYSCALADFESGMNKLYNEIGWDKNCKLKHKDDPTQFTIFWQ